ncbi:MAG: membrane protein insertase YidC [Holosporales bacterium]
MPSTPPVLSDQNRLVFAIALSLTILLGFHYFYERPQLEAQRVAQLERAKAAAAMGQPPAAAFGTQQKNAAANNNAQTIITRDAALTSGARVTIASEKLIGSINLTGAKLDDLLLTKYGRNGRDDDRVILLAPQRTENAYYTQVGWLAGANTTGAPDGNTVWTASAPQLSPGQPVTLSWDNGAGLVFEQEWQLDKDYLLTVTQRVRNAGANIASLLPYSLSYRTAAFSPKGQTQNVFEGPLGVFDKQLKELSADTLLETGQGSFSSTGGWVGFSDHYWLVALIPPAESRTAFTFKADSRVAPTPAFQVDSLGEAQALTPGETITSVTRIFAGAKEVEVLDQYRDEQGLHLFDRAIDFGWFYFLTKPMFYVLHYFYNLFGNFGIAIMMLTLCVRIIMGPLAHKSFVALNKMKDLQPQMKAMQERHKDDKAALQKAMMELYKKEKVNPVAGCLPILLQIPVFFSLYKVLLVSIEMRHAPFFGWIVDLAQPDPTSIFNLFGVLPWDMPSFLMIGVWPILVGVTMWGSQKLNPPPTDPVQKSMFAFMPWIFMYITSHMPAGLAVYWAFNNVLSAAQQLMIKRMVDKKA